ncbi:MAG: patatin-like phospholipase family protein [Candidatus Melainabacteria bacterium]|nr:patatin-like phospholipase family protein [Candidatus Melainabacteria bacterium]
MREFNLILSGGGVKAYTHLGIYKYCFERGIKFNEIVAVSGGALIAPFIFLERHPDSLIYLFKESKVHKKVFPLWFIPNKFEFVVFEPSTIKIGLWLEKQFTKSELNKIENTPQLHIMATKRPDSKSSPLYCNVLRFGKLKDAIAATTAISGVFKAHKVGKNCYVDGAHWNNTPLFFDFADLLLPVLVVNLSSYTQFKETKGRISKIIRGYEISSYARFIEDLKRWEEAKTCKKRGELTTITPNLSHINPLDLDLTDEEIDKLIDIGYKAAKEALSVRFVLA